MTATGTATGEGAEVIDVLDLELDGDQDFFDVAYERGWTDGLPVVAPTASRVAAMVAASGQPRASIVARIGPRGGAASVERIAVNAVMAGCRPEYMPTLIAAVRLLAASEMNIAAVQATTAPATPLAILNGPERVRLASNVDRGCLGPGNRANSTIGRAIRLVLLNIGGGIVDDIDKATHGLPGKYSLFFAENEEGSPWPSLSVEYGCDPQQSAVTMTSVVAYANVRVPDPEDLDATLGFLADSLATSGTKHVQTGAGNPVIVLSPGLAKVLHRDGGYSKATLKEKLFELARRPAQNYRDQPHCSYNRQGDFVYPYSRSEDLVVVVAGGPEPNQAIVMSSFVDSAVLTQVV